MVKFFLIVCSLLCISARCVIADPFSVSDLLGALKGNKQSSSSQSTSSSGGGSSSGSKEIRLMSDLEEAAKGYVADRQKAAEKFQTMIKDSGSALTTPGELRFGNNVGGVAATYLSYMAQNLSNVTMCNGPNPLHTMYQLTYGYQRKVTTVGNVIIIWDHYLGIPSGECVIVIPLFYVTIVLVKDNIEYYSPAEVVTTSNSYFTDKLTMEPLVRAQLGGIKQLQKETYSLYTQKEIKRATEMANFGLQSMGASGGSIKYAEPTKEAVAAAEALHNQVLDSDESTRFLGTEETGGMGRIHRDLMNRLLLQIDKNRDGKEDIPHVLLEPEHIPDLLPGFGFTKHTLLGDAANLASAGSGGGVSSAPSLLTALNPFQCVGRNKETGPDGNRRFPLDLLINAVSFSDTSMCLPNIGFTYRPLEQAGYVIRSDKFSEATDSTQKLYEKMAGLKLSLTEAYSRKIDKDKFMAMEGFAAGGINLKVKADDSNTPPTGPQTCVLQSEAHHPPVVIPKSNQGALGMYDYNAVTDYAVFRGCYSLHNNSSWPVPIRWPIPQVLDDNYRLK